MSAADFLVELNAQKSLEALHNCYSQKSLLIFKSESLARILQARIENLVDKKVILKFEKTISHIDLNEIFSMKFNVGTEVYFVKTPLKKFINQYYFELSVPVIELKRRKEVRYVIPKKWNQSITISGSGQNRHSIAGRILDLSISGLRIEVSQSEILFKIDQKLQVQFKIHQRATITCFVRLRFLKLTVEKTIVLGAEFQSLTSAQIEKINSLVDDLKNFIAVAKS